MARNVTDEVLAPAAAALRERTAYRLVKLGERLMAVAENALAPLGIRPRHLNVLATLAADESLSQQEVSRLLRIDPNVMVGVIDDLEELGLAERQRNPKDRRRHVVVLTAAGQKVLQDGTALLDEAEVKILSPLSAEERRVLHDVAGRLLDAHWPLRH